MSDSEHNQFKKASFTYTKRCSALCKNDLVMIQGKACKIVDMTTCEIRGIVHIVALDIFGK